MTDAEEIDKKFKELENMQLEVHKLLYEGNWLQKFINFPRAYRLHLRCEEKFEELISGKWLKE
ncbi:MAG: hypothetical protein WA061_01900 [Microgenomates group bacterium]